MSKAETNRLCVGIDLHKTQFTVCALNEDAEYLLEKMYRTKADGYNDFIKEMHSQEVYSNPVGKDLFPWTGTEIVLSPLTII